MTSDLPILRAPEWQERVAAHRARIEGWALARRERAGVARKHPVYDFLFEYYSFRPSQLMRWSPGVGIKLESAHRGAFEGAHEFSEVEGGIALLPGQFPVHRIKYLHWAINYLERTAERPAQLSCFGLHEWAMVYRTDAPRYPNIPMRLSNEEIHAVCDAQPLRCTHYDAFRFFTPAAVPLNKNVLSREGTSENDQPGCIHVTMDLYRFAYKIAPFIEGELMADCFELAVAAREIDMRASPYDLADFGFEAIRIEEVAGRAEYAEAQLGLSLRAVPVRERLLGVYRGLVEACGDRQNNPDPRPDPGPDPRRGPGLHPGPSSRH